MSHIFFRSFLFVRVQNNKLSKFIYVKLHNLKLHVGNGVGPLSARPNHIFKNTIFCGDFFISCFHLSYFIFHPFSMIFYFN